MTLRMPDRKVLAGGVTGILIYLTSLVLEYFGIDVSSDVLGLVIAVLSPSVSFMIPPAVKDVAARLDADIREVFLERQADTPGLTPPRERLPL